MLTLVAVLAGIGALLGAVVAVSHRNAVVGALFLVLNLLSVAVFYVLLDAPFVAAIQVIVYAGAIMVLFLFIIMLLDLRREDAMQSGLLQRALAAAAGALLLLFLARGAMGGAAGPGGAFGAAGGAAADAPGAGADAAGAAAAGFGSTAQLAAVLFSKYLLPFEVVSVLLLAALVGAVVLARRRGAGEDGA